MAARLRIVVGFKPDGSPEPLYMGDSGQDAMQAYEKPTHKTHSRVEYFQFPQASKRRSLVAPKEVSAPAPAEVESTDAPQDSKPAKPAKPAKAAKPSKKNE